MSMGALGVTASVAGTPLQQSRGSDVDTSQQAARDQARRADAARHAEAAAGVGETAEDQETEDRDADGRRLWERPPEPAASGDGAPETAPAGLSKDATGQSGVHLDLLG
jgi:hypothetical protein